MTSMLSRAAVAALNHLLERASWARERLLMHPGKTLRLNADPLDLLLAITPAGTFGAALPDASPDVTLQVPFGAAPAFLSGGFDKAMNAVKVEGSAELAETLGFVFRNLRWDAEEDLSSLVGDIGARRAILGVRALAAAHTRICEALGANLAEYLGEERAVLVTGGALVDFAEEVRRLRDDVARVEKRAMRIVSPPAANAPRMSS